MGAGSGNQWSYSVPPFLPTLCRAMSHQILLLLALLTLGLATSQRDKVPCKMVSSPTQVG